MRNSKIKQYIEKLINKRTAKKRKVKEIKKSVFCLVKSVDIYGKLCFNHHRIINKKFRIAKLGRRLFDGNEHRQETAQPAPEEQSDAERTGLTSSFSRINSGALTSGDTWKQSAIAPFTL